MPSPLQPVIAGISRVLLGKTHQVRLCVACLLARGHLLLEDKPGMGKTTLAEALARSFGLAFQRVHFTSDLLPADLTGINVWDGAAAQFRFHPGPLFAEVLLADEINRASPRTQSALLEAMASGRVSVEGTSHTLPQPFVVIASQNGLDQRGTSALPESQLDRFLMRLSLGYPDREAERAMLSGGQQGLDSLSGGLQPADLLQAQQAVAQQHTAPALLDYVLDLVQASRDRGTGLSPRAAKDLIAAARAWSYLEGRDCVLPDDVQAVFEAVSEHRLDGGLHQPQRLSRSLLECVDALR
jgi:MoxR-like ATPase